jgi:hypothetical protein
MAEPTIKHVGVSETNDSDRPSNEKDAEQQLTTTDAVTKKKQSVSDIFTIICAGFALISDGYQNNLM